MRNTGQCVPLGDIKHECGSSPADFLLYLSHVVHLSTSL